MDRISDKAELIELTRRIIAARGTEEEQEELLELLERSVPHPDVSDLIYYPPEGKQLTAEEIVERALERKPLQL